MERRRWILLALIVLVAAWLRLYNLGLPGLERNDDEDIMAIAVLGINEHGYPLMPSGMIYVRSGPLLYLMAGSTQLFGFGEFALRLPAAIFGILLVPLGFLVANRFYGRTCATAVAVLIALSLWQVEVSRTARMYAPFAFLYLLSIYGICRGYVSNISVWRWLSIPVAMLAVTVHTLGFTLAVLFFLAAVLPQQKLTARLLGISGAGLTALTFFVTERVSYSLLARPWMLAAADAATNESQDLSVPEPASSAGLLELVYQMVSRRLYLPPHLFTTSEGTLVLLVLGIACVGLALLILRRWPALRHPLPALLLVFSFVAAALHQFGMASFLLAGLVFVHGPGLRALRDPPIVTAATVLVAVFIVWLVAGVSGVAAADSSVQGVLKSLLDYPRVEVIREFVTARPLLTLLATVGILSALHRASVERRVTPAAFLAIAIILALALHGLFQSQFRPRYNFNLDVPFLIFVVVGAFNCLDTLSRSTRAFFARPRSRIIHASTAFLIALVIALDVRAWASPAYPRYWEGSAPGFVERFAFPPTVDRRSPALYVAQNMNDSDQVVSMDWLTTYAYVHRVDYWSRTTKYEWQAYEDHGVLRDLYLGAEILPDARSLDYLIDLRCRPALWMVTSANIIRHGQKTTPEVMAMLQSLAPYRVYTGLDGISAAYRFPRQDAC